MTDHSNLYCNHAKFKINDQHCLPEVFCKENIALIDKALKETKTNGFYDNSLTFHQAFYKKKTKKEFEEKTCKLREMKEEINSEDSSGDFQHKKPTARITTVSNITSENKSTINSFHFARIKEPKVDRSSPQVLPR